MDFGQNTTNMKKEKVHIEEWNQTEELTTSEMNLSWRLSSTNSRPAAIQFSPLLKNTPLQAYITL